MYHLKCQGFFWHISEFVLVPYVFYLMPRRIFNYSASIQEIQDGLVSCQGSSYVAYITFSYWHHLVHYETFILDLQELF